jgi:hypothetical protein
MSEGLYQTLEDFNYVLTGLFTMEMLLKLVGLVSLAVCGNVDVWKV